MLVLTNYDTDGDILGAVEAGASGYVLKDAPLDELIAAIRTAAAGETALASAIAARLHISEATVISHLVHIYTKLGVSSHTAAVATAREAGILR